MQRGHYSIQILASAFLTARGSLHVQGELVLVADSATSETSKAMANDKPRAPPEQATKLPEEPEPWAYPMSLGEIYERESGGERAVSDDNLASNPLVFRRLQGMMGRLENFRSILLVMALFLSRNCPIKAQ